MTYNLAFTTKNWKQGIRIFSVKEGGQKFESHTDSLINYILYWQSEGESKKTSIRTGKRWTGTAFCRRKGRAAGRPYG